MTTVEKNLVQTKEVSSLEGKVVVVTGSSKGIGATIAKELAKQGAKVVVNYNSSAAGAEKVVGEIEELGGTAIAVKANVSNIEDAKSLIEQTIAQFGKVDVLVNNAGITRDKTFKKMDEIAWNEVINTNLNSVYHTTSAVINPMLEQKFGRIINISSIVGQAGAFGQTNYSASKAGIIGFTKSLALETAKNGITVNAVCPGYILTEMTAEIPENVMEAIVSKIPMKRMGTTQEIAEAVIFLAKSDYITGQCINVNGGVYM
ncbi:MAG: 3-oxoacyl-[acyl-carrier-protein] reductase [Bacillota bacterium]|jgi:acetoacetyl-CoA reductase|nr:3-oxoacyl-[acyl-carrier-protein] reductase [Bacillota bacterium]